MTHSLFEIRLQSSWRPVYYSATSAEAALEHAAQDARWGSYAIACNADPTTWTGVRVVALQEDAGDATNVARGVEALTTAADGWGTLYRIWPAEPRLLPERLSRVVQALAEHRTIGDITEFVTVREVLSPTEST